jgi:hypothetical protein
VAHFLGNGFVREIRETIKATSAPIRLLQYGAALYRRRSLRTAFSDAQIVLGQRMYAAGIDDGHLGAQIARLDRQIHRAEAAGVRPRAQEDERNSLHRLLAACALEEEAPLPGADAEYAAAREVQILLANKPQPSALSAPPSFRRAGLVGVGLPSALGR